MKTFDSFLYRLPLFLFALVLLCLIAPAHAQSATRVTDCDPATPSNAICITHTAVVTRIDGLPTIFPVTYRVEQKVGTGAFTAVETNSALKHYVKNLAPGDYTFRVFAIENSMVSDASNLAGKSVVQANPTAPVIIIAATIRANAPPTYRIIQQVTLKPNEIVMVAPASMKPLFASR